MGSIYKRGDIWWVQYFVGGRPIRESSRSRKRAEAKRFLMEREGQVATGQPVLQRADRVSYGEAVNDLRLHYQVSGARNVREAEQRLRHLDPFFTGRRLTTIGPADITAYVARRKAQGAANGTINRELATLSRALRLAYENNKLMRVPVIRKLKESAPRQGFFEAARYEAVRQHLRPDLHLAVSIAYTLGWRLQGEVLTLARRNVDLVAGTLRLDPGTTKSDDAKLAYLTPELKALLTAQVERVRTLERGLGRIIPHLFPHLSGPRQGHRVKEFRKSWASACKKAGCLGRLRHDFRRTAVRNPVNLGIPEKVAMEVTGHRTRAVFDRYHIVAPGDLQEVARKLSDTIG
jgi:integrase